MVERIVVITQVGLLTLSIVYEKLKYLKESSQENLKSQVDAPFSIKSFIFNIYPCIPDKLFAQTKL